MPMIKAMKKREKRDRHHHAHDQNHDHHHASAGLVLTGPGPRKFLCVILEELAPHEIARRYASCWFREAGGLGPGGGRVAVIIMNHASADLVLTGPGPRKFFRVILEGLAPNEIARRYAFSWFRKEGGSWAWGRESPSSSWIMLPRTWS